MRRIKQKKNQEQAEKTKSKFATNTFSAIIILIIVFGFLFTFFRGGFQPATRISFGSYAGKDIVWEYDNYFGRMVDTDYNQREEALKSQLQAAKTDEEKAKIKKQLNEFTMGMVMQRDFKKIVFHVAVLLEAERSGVRVSDKRVQQAVADFFRSELLKYDEKRQRENKFLDLYVKHKDYFRESMLDLQYNYDRRALLVPPSLDAFQRQYMWDFSRLLTSPKEVEYAARIGKEQRKFDFVLFNYDDYPISKILEYVNSDPAHKEKFLTINLSRIIFTGSKEEAQSLRSDIINGKISYEEKADKVKKKDEYAADVVEQYPYYYYELEDIVKDKAKALLDLKTGELSRPIQIDEKGNKWIIYRCEKEVQQPDFSNPKMQHAVMAYLKFKEMSTIQKYFEDRAKELKKNAAARGFTAACNRMGITHYTTDYFSLNYETLNFIDATISKDETIKKLVEPAMKNQDFFIKAFSLKQNQVSDPIPLEKSIIVLHLTDQRQLTQDEYEKIESAYKNFAGYFAYTDLNKLLVKDKKLVDKEQEGIAAYYRLMQSFKR